MRESPLQSVWVAVYAAEYVRLAAEGRFRGIDENARKMADRAVAGVYKKGGQP